MNIHSRPAERSVLLRGRSQNFAETMTARVFGVMLAGICISACLALVLSTAAKNAEVRNLTNIHLVGVVANFVQAYRTSPPEVRDTLIKYGVAEMRALQKPVRTRKPAPVLEEKLKSRLPNSFLSIVETDLDVCYFAPPRAGASNPANCWLVDLRLVDGKYVQRALSLRADSVSPLDFISIYYILVLLAASAVLAFIVARMVTSPLERLSQAALAMGLDLDSAELPSKGPVEVRNAVRAFDTMRARLKKTLNDRTQMLAAITHDLQTPLTRLRLRAGRVEPEDVREKLLADIVAMQALVRDGLELAQSVETSESACVLDIDSMLQSLAQDAADAGQQVHFSTGCGAQVNVKPLCLQRSLSNLIENAVKFAGQAEISCHVENSGVAVVIRDYGPGIPDGSMAAVMEPYVRLEHSRSRKTGGVGLGLTIAQVLANKNNASVSLSNHPSGGLVATVAHLPLAAEEAGF